MDIHKAIARWESEGGAIPQAQTPGQRFKALMLRRILVPIDFSSESLNTLRYAKLLGERFEAKLHLVHVVTPPPMPLPQRAPLPLDFLEGLAANASGRLRKLAIESSLPMPPKPYSVRAARLPTSRDEPLRLHLELEGRDALAKTIVEVHEEDPRDARLGVLVDGDRSHRGDAPGGRGRVVLRGRASS